MLMEEQVLIKEEAKVTPVLLGLQWGFLGKWPPTKSQRGVSVSMLVCEVENLRLVMFQDKPKTFKQIEDNPVCLLEAFKVASPVLGLDGESSIIYIGQHIAVKMCCLGLKQFDYWGEIQCGQDQRQGGALSHTHISGPSIRREQVP
jgi:hypothetical protein